MILGKGVLVLHMNILAKGSCASFPVHTQVLRCFGSVRNKFTKSAFHKPFLAEKIRKRNIKNVTVRYEYVEV